MEAGDYVSLKLARKEIKGVILESYDKDVILVKLDSGYNIGIPRENVLDSRVIRKLKKKEEKFRIPSGEGKKKIGLIVTGGTIASKLDSRTGGVIALTKVEEFAKYYPGLFEKCDVELVIPFTTMSEDMNSDHWISIAREVKKLLDDKKVEGVVITHGSDFLHYTAQALSFFLQDLNKPVVLTLAQKSIDRASSDASLNLQCAVEFALSNCAEVVIVGHASENDDFCYAIRGVKARKMHTSRRDAFRAINDEPIARVYPGKIEFLGEHIVRGDNVPKLDAVFNKKVALVKFYPGQNTDILDYYLDKGYKGIVVEIAGLGHVAVHGKNSWLPKLKKLRKKGIPVFGAAQTIHGAVNLKVYSNQRIAEKAGLIGLKDMLPETAYVKLGWVLGHKWDPEKKMLENVAGEFNELLTS